MSDVQQDGIFDAGERQSGYDFNTRLLTTAVFCLFFVVALLVFLHLYVRYALRRQRAAQRTSIVSLFRIGPATAPHDDAPNPGLDPSAIAALPTFPYRRSIRVSNGKNDGSDAECTICLSVIEEGERVRLLPSCKHVFHVSCIDMWLSSTSTCPVCRAVVEPAQTAVTVEMDESSASQPGMLELSGGSGGAESTSGSKEGGFKESGSMSSRFSSSFRRMYMLSKERPVGRRTTGDAIEDLERQ